MTKEELAAIQAAADKAHQIVVRLCKPTNDPEHLDWIMHIPARPDSDPDLVIGAALRSVRDLISRIRELETQVLEANARAAVCVNAFKALQMVVERKITEETFNSVIASSETHLAEAAKWLAEYSNTSIAALAEARSLLNEILNLNAHQDQMHRSPFLTRHHEARIERWMTSVTEKPKEASRG